ncbi:MAG: hypothetical protein K4305_07250 [Chlorobium sp.]|uniref:hypothetical protein n=1 Tax=Chlorobium sp. TaxID=1095 RepID=UPI002F406FFF
MADKNEYLLKGNYRLVRNGTSRTQRFLQALDPSFAPVDDRGIEHGMVFAKAFSAHLRYYDASNVEVDDWQRFFSDDLSVLLAEASIRNVDDYRITVKSWFDVLKNDETDETVAIKVFSYLFSAAATLAQAIDLFKERLPESEPIRSMMENLVKRQLAPALRRLAAYYKAGKLRNLIEDIAAPDIRIFDSKAVTFGEVCIKGLSEDWITDGSENWNSFFSSIQEEFSPYGPSDGIPEQINHIATHNLFNTTFHQLLKAYARTTAEARAALADNIANRNDHKPHYALFLSFLQLMEYAREHMNTLTGKHLDFYYKEVLRLTEKAADPNRAHLVFQLAKNGKSCQIPAGTAFSGGKDSLGKDVIFTLDADFVPNTASVGDLKSVFRSNALLYAFPVSNSDDGRGADLTATDGQWPCFGGKLEDRNLASTGFALSSHILLLGEGERRIRLTLVCSTAAVSVETLCNAFDFQLTGDKGWITATPDSVTLSPFKKNVLEIPLLVDGSQPPVVALNRDLHGDALPEGLPALRAMLKQESTSQDVLHALRSLVLVPGECHLDVCVGYDGFNAVKPNEQGLKNLSVYTKFGEIRPDKPFQPFGPTPETNDYLIVGCDELFQKSNALFQFRLVWKGLPEWIGDIDYDWVNEFYPNISVTLLQNGIWSSTPYRDNVQIFYGTRPDVYFPSSKLELPAGAASGIHFDARPYTQESRNGFLKLTLKGDFGHQLYRLTLSRYLMKLANGSVNPNADRMEKFNEARSKVYRQESGTWMPIEKNDFVANYVEAFSEAMPIEPYTPRIESLRLSYRVSEKFEKMTFSWITPFGYTVFDSGSTTTLLPESGNEGEFCIGIDSLVPGQNLSLLFQLAEGSADPEVKKPAEHVQWCYLKNNRWKPFDKSGISDETAQLTRSGIIRFSIPKDATNSDTLFLASSRHWLRAAVADRSTAVCKAIGIHAQAARVTFSDQGNAPDLLSAPLPAGSITKLAVADAAIRKVSQPYPAFGGRPPETSELFRTRVSERLRHKNRAITLWDYERMILDAFPGIHKVKCLNHTLYEPGVDGKPVYREAAPGHVTIITIPDLQNRNAVDPLRPCTNLGDLELIRKYLQDYVSGFVKLHVGNPVFESVRVSFRVKFFAGADKAFCTDLLQNDLVTFLSPWISGKATDISFGGSLYKSSLIDFVEEQPYVDYVTDFKLFHRLDQKTELDDSDEVSASKAVSILVSANASEHAIEVIDDEADT